MLPHALTSWPRTFQNVPQRLTFQLLSTLSQANPLLRHSQLMNTSYPRCLNPIPTPLPSPKLSTTSSALANPLPCQFQLCFRFHTLPFRMASHKEHVDNHYPEGLNSPTNRRNKSWTSRTQRLRPDFYVSLTHYFPFFK